MAFPPVPTPQGVNSKTFVAPPIDGSLTVPQVFDFNAEHSPNHPWAVYEKLADAESSELPEHDNLDHITYKQLQRGIHRVAKLIETSTATRDPTASTVVGILALADTVTYFSLVQGIIRAGLQPFPISPRNSPAGLVHLLQKTKTAFLFVSGDPNMTALSGAALKASAAAGHPVEKLAMPNFHQLYEAPQEDDALPIPPATPIQDLDTVALYLHSSGMCNRLIACKIDSHLRLHLFQEARHSPSLSRSRTESSLNGCVFLIMARWMFAARSLALTHCQFSMPSVSLMRTIW